MSSAPDSQQRENILQGWQSGVERLGFLFELPASIVMADLVGMLDEFLALARGEDPSPLAPRSEFFERNLAAVQGADPDALASDLGCLFGEAVVERYGWRWVRLDNHACGLAAPKNAWLLDPLTLLYRARAGSGVDVGGSFAALADLPEGKPGSLQPVP